VTILASRPPTKLQPDCIPKWSDRRFVMNAQRRSRETGDLWAIGYDDMTRATQVKDEIIRLGWDEHYLMLSDVAVVVRHLDGSFTLDQQPFPAVDNVLGCTLVGLLAGLVVAAPLAGAAVGAVLGGVCTGLATAATLGIGDDFMREVEDMMKPGTSALFVLADEGDMDVVLYRIRGLGGTVLKTNVDMEQAKLIQSTLAESPEP
jgi:uncharacterized membrane protein